MMEYGYRAPQPDEIDQCQDMALLARWFRELAETIDDQKCEVKGFAVTGVVREEWMQRVGKRIGVLMAAMRRIERRLLAAEVRPPYLETDPRSIEVVRQAATIRRLKRALSDGGIAIPESVQDWR